MKKVVVRIMKTIFTFFLLIFIYACNAQQQQSIEQDIDETISANTRSIDSLFYQNRLDAKIKLLKEYLKNHPVYNQNTAVLIDMKKPSGLKRFYLINLDSSTVINSGLVSHGSGSETGIKDSLQFSNTPNSYMSSLGKYKIGGSYIGNFGKSYKLHGLDATNSKAYDRLVVLHRYSCVPDEEQVYEICNSLGCPMVSENYFLELDSFISTSKKPMLMEIYY